MTIKTVKKERESVQSLIRRFSRSMRRSGTLLRLRRNQFHSRNKSNEMKKKAALRREELKNEYEKKKKLGLLEDKFKRF
ncbi:MAG: hypothetical protein ABH967_02340 [Patescibacteria group bacterium]